jgi:hypothetical protein
MKLLQLTITFAVCCALCTVNVFAQQLRQPTSIYPASSDASQLRFFSFLDDPEEEEDIVESPSDMIIEDEPGAPVARVAVRDADKGKGLGTCDPCHQKHPGTCDPCGGKDGKGCGKGCGCGGGLACMCEGDPWTVWSVIAPCAEERRGLTAGGWFQIGYHTEGANGDGTGTGMFNDYPNIVQLQQAWVWMEKAIDPDRCHPWDWGFRMDYVYGTDGQNTQAFGGRPLDWDNSWDNGGFYGSAIPQLYFTVAYNDLSVKMGHFYTICGYEVVPATGNFFYSHAFTMVNAEPFTHTGILAEYAVNDSITVWGGYTAGWDTGFSRNYGDIFLGGFSAQLFENITFIYTTTMGNFGFGLRGSDDSAYSHSIVVDVALTDKLNYVFQSDYVDNDLLFPGAGVDKAWGINQYLLYWFNDCIGAGARVEYFDDERFGGEVWATTLGVNIKPHANVIFRPEVRFEDWDPATGRQNSTLFGMDMIFTF